MVFRYTIIRLNKSSIYAPIKPFSDGFIFWCSLFLVVSIFFYPHKKTPPTLVGGV